jgi:hypothetical protein
MLWRKAPRFALPEQAVNRAQKPRPFGQSLGSMFMGRFRPLTNQAKLILATRRNHAPRSRRAGFDFARAPAAGFDFCSCS